MDREEKIAVALELRQLYARVVNAEEAIKALVGEHFMAEMDEIDDVEAKMLQRAIVEGALDPENELSKKADKLQPWIDKVLEEKKGEADGSETA